MKKFLLKITPRIFKDISKKVLKYAKNIYLNYSSHDYLSFQEIKEFERLSDKFIFCFSKIDLRANERKKYGFEPDWLQKIWIEFLSHSDLIIDVGANIGEYSLPYISSKKNAYLYEANPLLIPILMKTISLNKINQFLELKNIGLGDQIKLNNFIINISNSGFSSSIFRDVFILRNDQLIKTIIPQTTIDNDIGYKINHEKAIALKIDIEGYDFYALKGCLKTIKKTENIFLLIEYGEYLKEKIFTKEDINILSEFKWYLTIDNGDYEVKKINFNRNIFTKSFFEKNFKNGVNLMAIKGERFNESLSKLKILD